MNLKIKYLRCLKKIRINKNGSVKCFNFVDLKNCQIKHKNSKLLLSNDLADLDNQIEEEIEKLKIWEDDNNGEETDVDVDDDDDDDIDEDENEEIQ